MEFPGIGPVERDEQVSDWLCTEPLDTPLLGRPVRYVLDVGPADGDDLAGLDPEGRVAAAVAGLRGLDRPALEAVSADAFAYYRDTWDELGDADRAGLPRIESAETVWEHVDLGDQPIVTVRDDHAYVSLECECAWEPEHGLGLVFRDGLAVTKLGPCDGHPTNADAYDDDSFEDVVYVRN